MITSNRDFNEWPLVFANPLMTSATMDRLVHRAVKIIIEGKSYSAWTASCAAHGNCRSPWRIPPRPAEGPSRPSSRDLSPGTGPKCAPKLAHRAISAFPALRHSLVSPRSAVLRHHRRMSRRTPRRSGHRRFKSCLRLESDGTEYPNKEVRVDSTLAPDYNLSDQPGRGVLFDADLGSLCLPIHKRPARETT